MPKHGYKPVVQDDGHGNIVIPSLAEETPAQAIARAFFEAVGGHDAYGKDLHDDYAGARKSKKTQAVQVYHNIVRGWAADAVKDANSERDGLPYDSEEERAQLIEMLLEEVLDSRELRRKFVFTLAKRDTELIDELYEQRQKVIEVQSAV